MLKTISKVDRKTRRSQIVQAALGIIGRKGVSALTTSSIAREVGISEANIYRHFRNKDEILTEMAMEIRRSLEGNLSKVAEGTPLKSLREIYKLHLEYIENNEGIPRLIFSEQLHSSTRLKKRLLSTIGSYAGLLADIFVDGQKCGDIQKRLDPDAAAMMMIGMVQVSTLKWSLSGFNFSLVKEGMKLWSNFERCVRT